MFILHKRRIRGYIIEVIKIQNKFVKSSPEVFFEMNNVSVTRGNGMKLKVQRYNTIARKSSFNVKVYRLDINRGKGNSDKGRGREREIHELVSFIQTVEV